MCYVLRQSNSLPLELEWHVAQQRRLAPAFEFFGEKHMFNTLRAHRGIFLKGRSSSYAL